MQYSIIGNNAIQYRSHTELHSSSQVVGPAQHTRIQDVHRAAVMIKKNFSTKVHFFSTSI